MVNKKIIMVTLTVLITFLIAAPFTIQASTTGTLICFDERDIKVIDKSTDTSIGTKQTVAAGDILLFELKESSASLNFGEVLLVNTDNGDIITSFESLPAEYMLPEDIKGIDILVMGSSEPATEPTTHEEGNHNCHISYDDTIIVMDENNDVISNDSTIIKGNRIKIIAKTFTDKKLDTIKINGTTISTENGCEYSIPSDFNSSDISITASYTPTGYNSMESSQLTTYISGKAEISCDSDQVDMFYNNKTIYGDVQIDKSSNGKVYFSVIESPSHGKITRIKYNGQKIKPRGYFFIDVNEYTFDHIIIEVEYER